jgi:hypothetical protein
MSGEETMLVAGIDSSTQEIKAVVRDAHTGTLLQHARAPSGWTGCIQQPDGKRCNGPQVGTAHGLAAVAVAAQQHGTICLHGADEIVRPRQEPRESVRAFRVRFVSSVEGCRGSIVVDRRAGRWQCRAGARYRPGPMISVASVVLKTHWDNSYQWAD